MPKHLFIFTIGPVQSFIAQARKTHDLWAGSKILSELIKVAIDKVGRENVRFPHAFPTDSVAWGKVDSLPNRFIAEVDWSESELQKEGAGIKCEVIKAWKRIADPFINKSILSTLMNGKSVNLDFEGIHEQIEKHFEIYWIIEPIVEGKYQKAYKNIEAKLGAIKNIRQFEQFNTGKGETGRKCSIDGERNVKFYRKSAKLNPKNDTEIRDEVLYSDGNFIFDYGSSDSPPLSILQAGEGLSAVSFVKRSFGRNDKNDNDYRDKFLSTADIALLNIIDVLKKNSPKWYLFKDNAQLLYEENHNDYYFKEQGLPISKLKEYQDELENINTKSKVKRSRFYALLRFDGDDIGKWVNGYNLTKKEDLSLFHERFPKQLAEFAKEAKDYIDTNNRGRTVYAGGDDFLGFINLVSLFDVITKLRQLFNEIVNDKLKEFRKDGKEITFSASILITHYKVPLQKVVQLSDALLKRTKQELKTQSKNGIGIAFLKKTGFVGETILKYERIELLKDIFQAIKTDKFNSRIVYRFADTFSAWDGDDDYKTIDDFWLQLALIKAEFKRLMLKEAKGDVKDLCDRMCTDLIKADNHKLKIDFTNLIEVIRILEAVNAQI